MFLALKELKHGKFRFIMIGTIIVLIAWLVFILSGLANGLSLQSSATLRNMEADYMTFEEGARSSMNRSLLSEDLVGELEKQENVSAATPIGNSMATILKTDADNNSQKIDIAILGIQPGSFLEPNVIEGNSLSEGNSLEVIVDSSLKDDGFEIGDILEIEGSLEEMQIVGFVQNESHSHSPAVFTTLEKWRAIRFAAPGSDNGIENPVNGIMLQGEDIDSEQLNNILPNTETVTKSEVIQALPGYSEQTLTFTMMLAFLLVISAFVLAIFFYVLTLQKTNQFGVLKAMGASNSFLGKAIVSQVFLLSLTSIVIGVILTYGTTLILPSGMPFSSSVRLVATYSIFMLFISIFSSLLSVRKIIKIDPLQAIGRVE